ncbi:hypothetical protein STEG23_004183 [Scotinomys teguina]
MPCNYLAPTRSRTQEKARTRGGPWFRTGLTFLIKIRSTLGKAKARYSQIPGSLRKQNQIWPHRGFQLHLRRSASASPSPVHPLDGEMEDRQ